MKKYMAIAGLVLVTVIWGGGFVASDMALDSLSPFQIMTIRFLLASVLMGGISIRNLKGIKKEEVTAGVFMGAALFIGFSLQIIGLQYTTPSKNAFLTATNVVIVPFIAFLICRKKVGFRGIIGAVLAIVGVGLLSLDKDLSLGLGDGLTLICAVGLAFSRIFSEAMHLCEEVQGICVELYSDVYGRYFIIDIHDCLRAGAFSGYCKRMVECSLSRHYQHNGLLSSSDSMPEVCG